MVKQTKEEARAARTKEAIKAEKEGKANPTQVKLLATKRKKDQESKKNRRVKFNEQNDEIKQLKAKLERMHHQYDL